MKYLKLSLSCIIFLCITYLGIQIIKHGRENQVYKKYYAELNDFKYGVFNVDEWKAKLSIIVAKEIENFEVNDENQQALRKQLEGQLTILLDKISERMKRENLKTTEGWLKQSFISSFVDMKEIKKGVPEYARAMLMELKKPKNSAQIKNVLKEKADDFLKRTFASNDDGVRQAIMDKLRVKSVEEAKAKTQREIALRNQIVSRDALIIIFLAFALFGMEIFSKGRLIAPQYILLILTLLVLLATGVTTPMIDMEAKISHFGFVLLGTPISFDNQILFFQSKSILDVFNIMITHKDLDMKLVGILVVSFSLIFPVFKMLSSLAYYYDYCGARQYKVVQFFVLKSGKWSMADVLVVAIFMAYIGFNGIINSQLDLMRKASTGMDMLTTNGTTMQPGYFLFVSYVILAMFLSMFLKSKKCALPGESTEP